MAQPKPADRTGAGGVLFLHHRTKGPLTLGTAGNLIENVAAFGRHSRYPVWELNIDPGLPPRPLPQRLMEQQFQAIVLHYSVFVYLEELGWYLLTDQIQDFIRNSDAYKLAFFQDEYHNCQQRFQLIDDLGIDCVFTMLESPWAEQVYGATKASRVVPHLPAYVSQELLDAGGRFRRPDSKRTIDVSYRGREMPAYLGRASLEKREIGERFLDLAGDRGLALDIKFREDDRIYGDDWYRFTAESRAVLGVESGVSCFDLDGEVQADYERLAADGHTPTVSELEGGALDRWDGKIPYRTLSPRNFEGAALRSCQILFDGHYSGALEPMTHYIPLRKDFSNLDEVLERFGDPELRAELTENAHRDLIASGAFTYDKLIDLLDEILADAGVEAERSREAIAAVEKTVRETPGERILRWIGIRMTLLYVNHPKAFRVVSSVAYPVRWARGLAYRIWSALGTSR